MRNHAYCICILCSIRLKYQQQQQITHTLFSIIIQIWSHGHRLECLSSWSFVHTNSPLCHTQAHARTLLPQNIQTHACFSSIYRDLYIEQIRTNDSNPRWQFISVFIHMTSHFPSLRDYTTFSRDLRKMENVAHGCALVRIVCFRSWSTSLSDIFISKSMTSTVYFGMNVSLCSMCTYAFRMQNQDRKVNQTDVTFHKIIWLICASACLCFVWDTERMTMKIGKRDRQRRSNVYTTPISTTL